LFPIRAQRPAEDPEECGACDARGDLARTRINSIVSQINATKGPFWRRKVPMPRELHRAVLPMRILSRGGLFSIPGNEIELRAGKTVIIARFSNWQEISLRWTEKNGEKFLLTIDVSPVELTYGLRWYFKCFETERKYSSLTFFLEEIYSKKFYNVRFGTPPRGARARLYAKELRTKDRLLGRNGYEKARGAPRRNSLDSTLRSLDAGALTTTPRSCSGKRRSWEGLTSGDHACKISIRHPWPWTEVRKG
jgi:hypothetical protein